MTYEQILSDLKNKIYKPVYFLMGEEPYYIDKITDYILENVLTESEKAFNQTILYGKDLDVYDIINTAKRFPMMSNHQVVVVREAQNIKNIEVLEAYFDNPQQSTILVLNYKYKSLDKRKKITKNLQKNHILFTSKVLYDNEVPKWIDNYLKAKGYSLPTKSGILLAEFLGNNLSKIVMELDKLIITLKDNEKEITPQHIETNIGISKDYNTFELQDAIAKRNIVKASN